MYTYIPISLPSCISLPPSLSHPSRWSQSTELISPDLPVLCSCLPLAIYFTFGSVYMSMLLSHFVPASPYPSPGPQVNSLHLRLYSCPVPRFIRTFFFFFKIPYICVSIWYLFFPFWPTSLCMTDSRSIHLTTNNSIKNMEHSTNLRVILVHANPLYIVVPILVDVLPKWALLFIFLKEEISSK